MASGPPFRVSRASARDAADLRKPPGRDSRIGIPLAPELSCDLALFAMCQPDIHRHEHREHGEREQCRPLEKEAEHDDDEPDVLRMANVCVRPRGCEHPLLLRLEDRGLFVRSADPEDGRRVYIELSDDAARALAAYLRAVRRIAPAVI